MKIVAGNSNLPLAESVAAYCNSPLTDAIIRRFSDQEVFVEIRENEMKHPGFPRIFFSGEIRVQIFTGTWPISPRKHAKYVCFEVHLGT